MDVRFETKNGNSMGKDEWLTPPHIIEELGPFDCDPCSPINRPWETAKVHYTVLDDGLKQNWDGFVWCNPPYGKFAAPFLERMVKHNNGIVLIFARTETRAFFEYVWGKADALLFVRGRIAFHHVDGTKAASAGAPSVLVAYGPEAVKRLENCNISGKLVYINGDKK